MKPDKYKKKDYIKNDKAPPEIKPKKEIKITPVTEEEKIDNLPTKDSKKSMYRGDYYTNALSRYLRKNINKNWDDIYSELTQKLGHKLEDIKYTVELNTLKKDDKIVAIGYGETYEVTGFYVFNGILGENPKRPWKKTNTIIKTTFVGDYVVFKHNGIYYKAPTTKSIKSENIFGGYNYMDYNRNCTGVTYTQKINNKWQAFTIEAKHIRQLSTKELKTWNLPNTEINKERRPKIKLIKKEEL